MKAAISIVTLTVLVAGCASKTDANKNNFSTAIGKYLDKRGDLRLGLTQWPVYIVESNSKQVIFNDKYNRPMIALESAGLAESKVTELLSAKAKSYTLTDAAKPYQRQIESRLTGKPETDLCWGKKALDKVVKWENPIKLGDYQSTNITYLYKIDGQAAWATNPEILAAFPSVKAAIEGAGKEEEQQDVSLTSEGWEPVGL